MDIQTRISCLWPDGRAEGSAALGLEESQAWRGFEIRRHIPCIRIWYEMSWNIIEYHWIFLKNILYIYIIWICVGAIESLSLWLCSWCVWAMCTVYLSESKARVFCWKDMSFFQGRFHHLVQPGRLQWNLSSTCKGRAKRASIEPCTRGP